jgi:hypothetical protein
MIGQAGVDDPHRWFPDVCPALAGLFYTPRWGRFALTKLQRIRRAGDHAVILQPAAVQPRPQRVWNKRLMQVAKPVRDPTATSSLRTLRRSWASTKWSAPGPVEGCGSRNGLFGDMAGLVGEDGVLPGGLHHRYRLNLLFGSHRGRFGWRPPRRN